MPFSGGGGGVLVAHTHDPAIPRDGGSLAANATSFSLANQSLLLSDGVNIQELALGSDGENLTSLGGAVSWEAHVAGDVLAGNLVMSNSTTIGDYTQPASATASSSGPIPSPDETNDFSSANMLEQDSASIGISGGVLNIITKRDGTNDAATWALPTTLSDSTWEIRCTAVISTLTQADATTIRLYIGPNSTTSATGASGNHDFIGLQAKVNSTTDQWGIQDNDGSTMDVEPEATFAHPISTETLYIKMQRTSTTAYNVGLYSDATYTTLLEQETGVCPATITNLAYWGVWNIDVAGTTSNVFNLTIDNLQVWDSGTAGASNPASNAVDDNLVTYWQSEDEVNPWIYADMGSSTTTSNLALYPRSTTTETEIKIQSSTDAIAWTDERTITWSNLTEGAWNYIRFNLVSAQYWRIYGNSGNSRIMVINEIKVLDAVSDANVRNLHGHIPISSSDTSLNNAGV